VLSNVTDTLETVLSSSQVPASLKVSLIATLSGGYVMERDGACVSTDSPRPTSQADITKTEAKARNNPKTSANFFINNSSKNLLKIFSEYFKIPT
jgi:hypothetical protein